MSDIDPVGDFIPDLDAPTTDAFSHTGSNGASTASDYFPGIEIGDTLPPLEDLPPLPEDDKPFGDVTQPLGDGTCVVCGAPTFRPSGLTAAGNKKRVPK